MARYLVDDAGAFASGDHRLVEAGRRTIVVFRVDENYYALRNVCPHHGAPLCVQGVSGTMLPSAPHTYEYGLEGRIVRCPWHGFEFDVADGRSIADPENLRVKTYEVGVEDGQVVLYA